jgi:hypothetical protein
VRGRPGRLGLGTVLWKYDDTKSELFPPTIGRLRTNKFFSDDQHFSAAGQLIEANYDFSLLQSGVPEPSTWAMLLIGFAGLGVMAYCRKPGVMAA